MSDALCLEVENEVDAVAAGARSEETPPGSILRDCRPALRITWAERRSCSAAAEVLGTYERCINCCSTTVVSVEGEEIRSSQESDLIMPSTCSYDSCTKQPSFGVDGSNKSEFCCEHKRDGMVDLKTKRCLHHGCSTQPSFGVDGSKKKEFCSEHKRDGMVDLKNKRCLHHGCSKQPSFGMEGSKKMEFCCEHKRDGMVDLKSKRCGHHGCSKWPSYGVEGSNKRQFAVSTRGTAWWTQGVSAGLAPRVGKATRGVEAVVLQQVTVGLSKTPTTRPPRPPPPQ